MFSSRNDRNGPEKLLRKSSSTTAELAALVIAGRRRLADAGCPSLAMESRADLACKAAYLFSFVALRVAGYRPRRRGVVFRMLPFTLGLRHEVWGTLAELDELRERIDYEADMMLDEELVRGLIESSGVLLSALDRSMGSR